MRTQLQLTRYLFLYQTRSKRSNLSLSIIPRKAVCWSSVDATIAAHTPAKACIAELPPRISAKGPIEIRKREVSFDKWAKWAIQQDMHALAKPVSSITATSIADQIDLAKEMDTPVEFQGGKRLGSKTMGGWRRNSDATTIKDALQAGATPSDMRNDFEKASCLSRISNCLNLLEGRETCDTWPVSD